MKTTKTTLKSLILDYVESLGNRATYTQIVRFAHDHKYGPEEWAINPNRRGYFSNAFYGQWVYDPNCKWQMYAEVGYLVKRNVKSGWLEKNSDGTYKTTRHAS